MAEDIFVVTTSKAVKVLSKPDAKSGKVTRVLAPGDGFYVYDLYKLGTAVWVRVSPDGSLAEEYACISAGGQIFARRVGVKITAWAQAVDAWARLRGFDGPHPQDW